MFKLQAEIEDGTKEKLDTVYKQEGYKMSKLVDVALNFYLDTKIKVEEIILEKRGSK